LNAFTRQYGELGRPFALGSNNFGWTTPRSEAFRILDEFCAVDRALVDTADVYRAPGGTDSPTAEDVIGQWRMSRASLRDRMLIATKVGADSRAPGLGAANIRTAALASLSRLNAEHIDVYYAHKDDPTVPLEETVQAFDALIDEGLIGGVGLSTFSAARMEEWIQTADRIGARRPVSAMIRYNLVSRGSFEQDYLPVLHRHDLGGFAYFALASGVLTGKFDRPESTATTERAAMTSLFSSEATFEFLPTLRRAALDLNTTPAAVAVRWLAGRDGVTAPVLGARTARQLHETLAGMAGPLPSTIAALLDEASKPFA
jgi:aryl-alcohol dehydrogenase-like predicted oxidoreductase